MIENENSDSNRNHQDRLDRFDDIVSQSEEYSSHQFDYLRHDFTSEIFKIEIENLPRKTPRKVSFRF